VVVVAKVVTSGGSGGGGCREGSGCLAEDPRVKVFLGEDIYINRPPAETDFSRVL